MRRYISLLLFVGLAFWSCEEEGDNNVLDTTPPVVSIISPIANAIVENTIPIAIHAEDDIEISHIDFYIDDILAHSDSESPYMYSWDTGLYDDESEHTIMVVCFDKSGNSTHSESVVVVVKNLFIPTLPIFVGNHPEGLYNILPIQIDEKLYFLGGIDTVSYGPSKSLYEYDIVNKSWNKLLDAPHPYPAIDGNVGNSSNIIHSNGKIYASSMNGGFDDYEGELYCNHLYAAYNISSNSWETYSPFTECSWYNSSEQIHQKAYRSDILTIDNNPYILFYSNNESNQCSITSLMDASLYKEVDNVGGYGFILFQFNNGTQSKHFLDTGLGFYQLDVNPSNTESLITLSSPGTRVNYSYMNQWNDLLVFVTREYNDGIWSKVFTTYNTISDVWNEYEFESSYNPTYAVRINDEQGTFVIMPDARYMSNYDLVYFCIKYETFIGQ